MAEDGDDFDNNYNDDQQNMEFGDAGVREAEENDEHGTGQSKERAPFPKLELPEFDSATHVDLSISYLFPQPDLSQELCRPMDSGHTNRFNSCPVAIPPRDLQPDSGIQNSHDHCQKFKAGVHLRVTDPRASAHVFDNGKMVCATSLQQCLSTGPEWCNQPGSRQTCRSQARARHAIDWIRG